MERPQYYEKTLTKTDKEEKLVLLIDWLDGRVLPIPNPGSEAIPVAFKDEFGKDFVFSLKVRSLNPAKKIKVESLKPQESSSKNGMPSLRRKSFRSGRAFTFGGTTAAMPGLRFVILLVVTGCLAPPSSIESKS
ncbi:hypothetical protein L484_027892 [Morus notabilis]|uniref:Uncharacterized protein n=1 Tax=Morus notabilis TaxID=981085 RepID=W9SVX9_9ROSA|nr:hypothetical protein L484_027892 [Morus notabilis]